jgi:hypothetical protein
MERVVVLYRVRVFAEAQSTVDGVGIEIEGDKGKWDTERDQLLFGGYIEEEEEWWWIETSLEMWSTMLLCGAGTKFGIAMN